MDFNPANQQLYYGDTEKVITFKMKQCFWTWYRHKNRIILHPLISESGMQLSHYAIVS